MSETFSHPHAIVDSVQIGKGTRVWAFSHVCRDAHIGAHCNIGEGCYIENGAHLGDNVTVKNNVLIWEGVTIENDVFIGPGVVFTNDLFPRSPRFELVKDRYVNKAWLKPTRICRGAALGANATILCGLTVGQFALIGAGAVVTINVPAFALVAGNPARILGHVCACGQRLPRGRTTRVCRVCGHHYRQTKTGIQSVEAI